MVYQILKTTTEGMQDTKDSSRHMTSSAKGLHNLYNQSDNTLRETGLTRRDTCVHTLDSSTFLR